MIVDVSVARVLEVPMVKLPDVTPGGITTLVGTVATEESEVLTLIVAPKDGAGFVSVKTPFAVSPPTTVEGCNDRVPSATGGGWITNVAEADEPFNAAEKFAV